MRFSIVVPNFNHAKYLEENLESIRAQSYKDFEVWICDNMSTDNSIDVARKYIEKDPRFHLGQSIEHYPSAAHNIDAAIRYHATGDIALWLNADDRFKEDYLTSVAPLFEDPTVGLVRVAMTIYFDDRDVIAVLQPLAWDILGEMLTHNKIYPPSPFRRKLFLDIGGMDTNCRFYDWDLWARMALELAKRNLKYADCHKPIVIRRIHTPEWNRIDEEKWDKLEQSSKTKIGFVQTGATYIYKKLRGEYETFQNIHLSRSEG